jgi:hypothetical protein
MLVLSRIHPQKAEGKRAKNFLFSPNRNGTENGRNYRGKRIEQKEKSGKP